MVVESSTDTPATHLHAYDHGSLVDRWYSIYDRHYRSQAAEPVFQPSRYTSVWNEADLRHAIVAGGTLGLEELRRAALEGMGTSEISAPRADDEGEYRTMPLEGRFDLIRPRTRAERKQTQAAEDNTETPASTPVPAEPSTTTPVPSTPIAQVPSLPSGSPVRWTTLPTPGINEIPPAPHTRLISLPATPLRYVPTPYKPLRNTREAGAQTVPIQSQQRESGDTDTDMPLTPLMWDSAIKTPPNVVTPAPTDTYFPKVGDIGRNWSPSSSDTSLTMMETSPSKPQPPSNAVFSPFPVHTTPETLRRQGKYRNLTREVNGSPTPDPTKVKRVFPWEERPRQTPGRVFPDERSPLTALPYHPAFATPDRKAAFRSPMPSPLVGFPPFFQSHYPSDGPLPQRYVGGVLRPISFSSPLGLEDELDRIETSSQDADVEDEVDSEEETVMRSRTRSSSIEMAKRTLKYRSIGVQTDPRDLREEGIQVTTFVPAAEVAEKLILMNKRLGRNWLTSTETTSPSAIAARHALTFPLLSPPILDSLTTLASDEAGDPSPSASSLLANSSISSPFPAGGPPLSHTRKGSRVWDPTRGVETFKRGSEEVLAKFVKIGTSEERA